MEKKALETINTHNMIQPGDRVLLGLSGGMDSAVLLHFLLSIRDKIGFELCAAHVDHGLRGDESKNDVEFCKRICFGAGILLEVFAYDVGNLTKNWGISIESAGRRVRYKSFGIAAKKLGCNKIATAHSRNDSVETMLLSLFRGSGMAGLAGIAPIRQNIIRPLIDISRDEITEYCAKHNIEYREDSSNASPEYQRNRVRNFLLPALIADYNPGLMFTMSRTAKILRDEDEFLAAEAAHAYIRIVQNDEILTSELTATPLPIARRVVRKLLTLKQIPNIAFEHIEGIIELAHGESGKEIYLPGGKTAKHSYGLIKITKKQTEIPNFCYKLEINCPIFVPEVKKWFYLGQKEYIDGGNGENSIRMLYTKLLDYGKIENELEIRTRKPGDLLYFSKVGTKKVKDFFINRKYPRDMRDNAVFVACGKNIVLMLNGFESDFYLAAHASKVLFLQIWEDIIL